MCDSHSHTRGRSIDRPCCELEWYILKGQLLLYWLSIAANSDRNPVKAPLENCRNVRLTIWLLISYIDISLASNTKVLRSNWYIYTGMAIIQSSSAFNSTLSNQKIKFPLLKGRFDLL